MKQRIGVPSLFRRRNSKKAAPAEAGEPGDDDKGAALAGQARDSDRAVIFAPPEGRVGAVAPTYVIDYWAGPARDTDGGATFAPPEGRAGAVAPAHVINIPSSRERSDAASVTVSTLTAGMPEAFAKRYADGCAAGIGLHGRVGLGSPDGASEAFESARARYYARRGDPFKEVRFRSGECGGSEGVREKDEDARTAQSSSSLFGLGLSAIDDNTRTTCTTNQSSSLFDLFPQDEELEDVSLEPESTTLDETVDETLEETLDETLEEATTSRYDFELIEKVRDGSPHLRRRYRPGVGQYATIPEFRKGRVKVETAAALSSSPCSHRDSRDDGAADASDGTTTEGAGCPLHPETVEEVLGSCSDLRSTFRQVLHAFCVSEEDVDAIAGRVRDAKVEVRNLYYRQQLEESPARRYRQQLEENPARWRQCGDLHFSLGR